MKLVDVKTFQKTINGDEICLFNLKNKNGMVAQITNYGARLVSMFAPDRTGQWDDVVLGYKSVDAYLNDRHCMGATIGRYANRIANAKFSLFGQEYQLTANDGRNHLHGGEGLQRKIWFVNRRTSNEIEMHCSSFDGDQGYPGNVSVTLIYRLREDNALHILFSATTDKATVLNLTNHTYFNLNGAGKGDILKHQLKINALTFTPVNEQLIPTGEVISVENTPFDFRDFHEIGERIKADNKQIRFAHGYDHNFVILNGKHKIKELATIIEPKSGRKLCVFGTQPGLQFYSSNFLKGIKGKRDKIYNKYAGFCLEAQHFPDSPHQPHFPFTILMPSHIYRHEIIYKMGIEA